MNEQLIRYGASDYYFKQAALYPDLCLARVTAQYKDLYRIATDAGEGLAELSGKLRYDLTEAGNLSAWPAVGDFVMAAAAGGETRIIHRILPRQSVFERAAPSGEGQAQVVAANIDKVFICMALNNDYNLSRLERYLSVAWNSGAAPVVVLTKADLLEDFSGRLAEVQAAAPGVDVVVCSSQDRESCLKLLEHLGPGETASFIGSSGVGKSTLINNLAGAALFDTAETRRDDKGRHTTTRRELLVLPPGGVVIDTPGMRELGADSVDLARSFADIDALAAKCRFRDCGHTTEPGCAVRQALETGGLSQRRLDSYRKLKREARYDGLSAKALEREKLEGMLAGVGGMKNFKKFIRENDKRKRRPNA